MSKEQPEDSRGPRGHVGRASRSPGRLWQVPVFVAGVLAFSAVAATAPYRGDNGPALFQAELTQLRGALEPGREKPAVLVAQAEELLARLPQFPRKAGEIHFLAGSAYFRQAGDATPKLRPSSQKAAIHHLEEALALGVPAGDVPALHYRLGLTLYQQGKQLKQAVDLMAQSIAKGSDRPAQAYGILLEAYLALPKPNLEAALQASQKQLELTDARNAEEMALARLARGKLLLRKELRQDALKELERISPTAPRPLRLQARLLQARICEDESLWNRAVPVWQELLKDADAVEGGKARLLYALGLAYLNSEPARPEQAQASWDEAFQLGGDEGQAAGLRLGELRLSGPMADVPAALAVWTKVLADVRTATDYKNPWLPLSRAQEFMENACRYFLDKKDYDTTRQIADLYKKIAASGVAEEHVAQAAEGLARELKEAVKVQALSAADEAVKLEEVRAQFHRAAVAYEEAAAARADEGQPEVYWRSAQCYLAARDYNRAGAVLSKFVMLQKNEGRIAEGLLSMAEAYAALGEKGRARDAYYKCIEYCFTPFACRARYQLALEEIDNKNYEQARAILLQNLEANGPVADRAAHEKSIFKIADVFTWLKDFDKAVLYYKEAIRQYPQNPGVLAAQDGLGSCYKQLAEQAKVRMNAAKDEKRVYYENNRRDWLEQGAKVYEELSDTLEHKAKVSGPLRPVELGLLRKALFEAAGFKFEANDFGEALRRYESLQDKYRKQVEGLIACYKIWECVGVMIATPEDRKRVRSAAAEAVKKARDDLAEMPAEHEAFHGGPAVWTKMVWQSRLAWIEEQLSLLALSRPTVSP